MLSISAVLDAKPPVSVVVPLINEEALIEELRALLAKSYARIHRKNLINFGIVSLLFAQEIDYDAIQQGDILDLTSVAKALKEGQLITVKNKTKGTTFQVKYDFSSKEIEILLAGGIDQHHPS